MTKYQLLSDITLRLSRGKDSSDFELEPLQIVFWLDIVLNAVVKAALDAKIVSGEGIDPVYFTIEDSEVVLTDPQNVNPTNLFYYNLNVTPMNLYADRGIVRVSTTDNVKVDKLRMEEIDNMYNLKFSKPSLKNLKYNRVGNRIYIHGLTSDTIPFVKFTTAYVAKFKLISDYKDNDPIHLSEEILPLLTQAVYEIGYKEVYGSSEDKSNDGIQQDNNQPSQQ